MLAYLDASAAAKLVAPEAESATLQDELRRWPERTSSTLLRLELIRVARRAGAGRLERARLLLAGLPLLAIDSAVLEAAESLDPPPLRALDAIHVATAASLGDRLGALVTYDRRMLEAAEVAGIETVSPR